MHGSQQQGQAGANYHRTASGWAALVWHELTVTAAQVKALLCGICKLVVREAILMHMDTAANLMPPVSTFFVPRVLKGGWNYFGQAKPCSVLFVDGSCGLSTRILF